MDLEVIRLDAGKEVRWRVKAGPQEWIGTDVTFSLSEADGQTALVKPYFNQIREMKHYREERAEVCARPKTVLVPSTESHSIRTVTLFGSSTP
jgi:hypothetical protein